MRDELLGRVIGKYRIEAFVGGGGQAKVYKAYHPALDTHVAIKILPPYFAAEGAEKRRGTLSPRPTRLACYPKVLT